LCHNLLLLYTTWAKFGTKNMTGLTAAGGK
jgi:hypothetical protein